MSSNYQPFKHGPSTGSTIACPICGVKPRNQHTLSQSAQCDWLKRPTAERARLDAAKQQEAA